MVDKKLQELLDECDKIAIEHVEKIARKILRENQGKVLAFVMAMGSYFFTDSDDNIITDDSEIKGIKELSNFIAKWDRILHITGNPMAFTAYGEKITGWYYLDFKSGKITNRKESFNYNFNHTLK